MGNILTDNNGNALLSGNEALEVTASIDSNIVAGNIKKDVTILGVTGTYEGSGGGGNSDTTFYIGSSTIPGAKGSGGGGALPPEPGTQVTFYVSYPNNNDKVPDMFIVYDKYKYCTNENIYYAILSTTQSLNDRYFGGSVGKDISITNITSTLATLYFQVGYPEQFEPMNFEFAPIYLNT